MPHQDDPQYATAVECELLRGARDEVRILLAIIFGLLHPGSGYGDKVLELPTWPARIPLQYRKEILARIANDAERKGRRRQAGVER